MSAAAARTFAALGHPTRLLIVGRLSRSARLNVTELTAGSGLSRQAVSKHLEVLTGAGLVFRSDVGRQTIYELRADELSDASDFLTRLSRGWDGAIERLRTHLDRSG